jgi:hypothetical protein
MNRQKVVWFAGVPGSKWSGIDIQLRDVIDADRSDESPSRTFYHRPIDPSDKNNGHRGSYWGPGMGCGEDWGDLNYTQPERLQGDIDAVFYGTGPRVVKSHFFARHWNLDYLYNHFPGDEIILVYRESQKSFAWWSEVMDMSDGHYPDYRPGYKNYDTMRQLIFQENAKIVDFAMRKGLQWELYNPKTTFKNVTGFNNSKAKYMGSNVTDVYIAICKIPEK